MAAGSAALAFKDPGEFTFAILGDRTGEAVAAVYQDHPDFVINVGDTIQGGNDRTVETEWQAVENLIVPYRRYKFFFVPGNHDIWSPASAQAFEKHTHHPLHYSFDYEKAHFTVLNNSRTDSLPPEELAFLENDLQAHAQVKLKFVFFHRPSWIVKVLLRDPEFPLHKLARQYGVRYVICGHLHEMLRFDLDGVTYLSMASSGGHLREPKTYNNGWFFAHSLVTVKNESVQFAIKELAAPFGEGRVSKPEDWSPAGLRQAGSH